MDLDQLDSWFKEAKQSLSIAGPICTEANELVLTSRRQIEEATVMWSKVMFINRAVNDQFELLNKIKRSFKNLQNNCIKDFQNALDELDSLEERLDFTLNRLENTILDDSFRDKRRKGRGGGREGVSLGEGGEIATSPGQGQDKGHTDAPHNSESKDGSGSNSGTNSGSNSGSGAFSRQPNLRFFVHDIGVDKLRKTISISVDKIQSIIKDISSIITSLESDINKFHKDMFSVQNIKRRGLETAHENTINVATDAHSMALLLESLTRHYDLTLKAIEMSKSPDKFQEDLSQIFKILENDSQQLERAVEELYEGRKFIEVSEKSVSEFYKQMNEVNTKVQAFFSDLLVFGVSKLSEYTEKFEQATQLHSIAMQEIIKLKQELQSLVDYYGLFYESYQSLILEVLRRKKSQQRTQQLIADLMNKVHDSYNEEVKLRQEFIQQYGEYLPNDLWEGLLSFPFEPQIVFETENIPEVSETSIAEATKRIQL